MTLLRRLLVAAAALLVVTAMAAGAAWHYADSYLRAAGPLQQRAVIVLPRGGHIGTLAQRLAEAGAIEHPWLFETLARLTGRDRGLKAGEYAILPGMSPLDMLALVASGKVLLHPIVVPEGLTVQEVYALLQESDVLAGELPPPPSEGSLLPETYLVPRDEPRAKLVERMQAAMRKTLDELWAQRRPGLGLRTPEEALTLASIIEKETAKPEEYGLVAAVFYNRLEKGMKLQTDPTVIYALSQGRGPLGRELTRADLEVDSPYNTYRVEGLPPGPIANPGKAALEAALDPAPVDYLYFVASGDGGHVFARTLEEHNRNVARWRRLKSQNGSG